MSARISVIIPIFNQWSLTAACLRSLAIHSPDDIEVIVIDNASTDETPRQCPLLGHSLFGERFVFLRQETNRNFGPACNLGARHAKADFLFFLNNDTVLTEPWAQSLLAMFDAPCLGATGPLLLYPSGEVQHAGIVFTPTLTTRHLGEHLPATHPVVRQTRPVQALTAAALFMRSALFMDLGGFYEKFQNGGEDVDLCARIRSRNATLRLCPTITMVHHTSQTQGRFDHDQHNAALLSARQQHAFKPDFHRIMSLSGYQTALTPWLALTAGLDDRADAQKIKAMRNEPLSEVLQELDREPLWHGGYALAATKTEEPAQALHLQWRECRFFPSVEGLQRLLALAESVGAPPLRHHAQENLAFIRGRLARPDLLRNQARQILARARQENDRSLAGLVDHWLRTPR